MKASNIFLKSIITLLFLICVNTIMYSQVSNPNNTWSTGAYVGWNSSNDVDFKINTTQHMIIKTSGNVGIGTTTPVNKLDVEGSAVIGANYSGTNTGPTNGLLVEGNVGIGTTGPSYKLDVSGDIRYPVANGLYIGTDKFLSTDAATCVFLGKNTNSGNPSMNNSIHIGTSAGQSSSGAKSVFIGSAAGQSNTGTDNVFIGYSSIKRHS